jgi:hypothetical protein
MVATLITSSWWPAVAAAVLQYAGATACQISADDFIAQTASGAQVKCIYIFFTRHPYTRYFYAPCINYSRITDHESTLLLYLSGSSTLALYV